MASTPDYDLLFGVVAAQLRFITHEQLIEASAQPRTRQDLADSSALREKLCELGMLSTAEAAAVAAVVEQQLARFGQDARKTLDSIGAHTPDASPPSTDDAQRAPTEVDQYVTQGPRAWGYSSERQRFKVLRLHQQGGLGRLMVAHDEELNREIALKEILPAYADHDDNRRRFIREAEITGALEHPGVVPVYSLGEFADGRPYYAMRLIRGVDLRTALADFHSRDLHANERPLEFRQLLGRFIDVCQAIDYAHNRGVIHRDIKPGNIMLGDFGETLVVDWGLAKPLDEPPASDDFESEPVRPSDRASSNRTQAGHVVGTLPYMSPEQAAGRHDQLSPASDVYSLGATLYHVLTGRPPFEADDDDDTVFRVQQGRFPPPRSIAKNVPRALDAICLKAMARKPSDRYASARALATDVERYLADERVTAYAEPMVARTWRWIRRHRTPVMSLMAAGVVALAGLSLGVALLRVQRDAAERNFQLAQRAVRDYYVRVSEDTLLNQAGMQPLRDALLRQALDYYRQFLAERSDDPQLRREAAQAQFFVGRITETIDSAEKALPHYREAASLQKKLLDDAGGAAADAGLAADYAQTLNALGRALQKLDFFDQARNHYQQAASLREGLAAAAPRDAKRARDLANSTMNLGLLEMIGGNASAALPLLERAQSLRLAHAESDNLSPPDLPRDLGMGSYNLALARFALGEAAAGERELLAAIAAFEQLAESQPQDFDNRRRLAICRRMIADAKAAAGEMDAAIDWYKQSRDVLDQLTVHNPNVLEYQADLAGVQMNLGSAHHQLGDLDSALEAMTASVDGLRRLAERNDAAPSHKRDLAVALRAAGQILSDLARRDEARSRLRESEALLKQLVREHPDDPAYTTELQLTSEALTAIDAA